MKIIKSKKIFLIWLHLSLLSLVITLPACWFQKDVQQQKSSIKKVYNLDLLKKEIKNFDKDSLVIFDVDQALFVSEGHMDNWFNKQAQSVWGPLHKKMRRCRAATGSKPSRLRMRFFTKRILLDKNILSVIENIKKQKAKVIALTASDTGIIGNLGRLETLRFGNLKNLGIDFSDTFKKYQDLELTELSYNKKGSSEKIHPALLAHPVFYKGVLMTARYKKGEVLKAFLDKINWWPKKIIFIDDSIEFLKDVQMVAREKGIDFQGFEYRAAEVMPVKIDPKVAEFQVYYFIENDKWISKDEAKKLMKDNVITWESIVKKYKISKEKEK